MPQLPVLHRTLIRNPVSLILSFTDYVQRSMNQISAMLKQTATEKNREQNEQVQRKLQSSVYRVLIIALVVAFALMVSATLDLIFADHWQFVVYPTVSEMVRSNDVETAADGDASVRKKSWNR